MYPRVVTIILNWNGWRDTIECLESFYQIDYPNYEVIVVDNGSTDDSIEKIKEYCEGKIKVESKFFKYNPNNKPIHVLEYTRNEAEKSGNFRKEKYFSKLPPNRKLRLILNCENLGFAEGNNVAIRYALKTLNPRYLLLLNNDTVVERNFLSELVKIANDDVKAAILGPKIYYYSHQKNIWQSIGLIDFWTGIGKGVTSPKEEKISYPYYISGCAMLVRKEVIKKLDGFDSMFFMYYEDSDFCFRACRYGYYFRYVPNSKVYHKVSASSEKVKNVQLYYYTRNRIITINKWGSKLNKGIFNSVVIVFFPIIIIREIIRGRRRYIKYIVKGILDGYNIKKRFYF